MDYKEYFKNGSTSIQAVFDVEIDIPNEVPDEMPKHPDNLGKEFPSSSPYAFSQEFRLKEAFNEMGMFGFVSWRWINPFVEWLGDRRCLEVMAGRGWLSYALRQKGVDVVATDDFSWATEMEKFKGWNNTVTEVQNLDAITAVENYGNEIEVLIMSWAYMDDTAYRVIKRLHEINPSALVVFIGEGHGGCTADDTFFEYFEAIEDDVFDNVASRYQHWEGLHDHLMLGKYTPKSKWDYADEE